MKKTYQVLIAVGILLCLIPSAAIADADNETFEDEYIEVNDLDENYDKPLKKGNSANADIALKNSYKDKIRKRIADNYKTDIEKEKKFVTIKGIWGHSGDNQSDGLFAMRIFRRQKGLVFKGIYSKNETEEAVNETRGNIVGIMRNGYLTGRIITPNGEKCKVVGLYNIDKENNSFKLRWMTPHGLGWAVGRIKLPSQ